MFQLLISSHFDATEYYYCIVLSGFVANCRHFHSLERVDISVSTGAIPKQTGIRGFPQGRDGEGGNKGSTRDKDGGELRERETGRTTAKEIKRRRSRQLIQHHGQRRGGNRLYPPGEKPKALPQHPLSSLTRSIPCCLHSRRRHMTLERSPRSPPPPAKKRKQIKLCRIYYFTVLLLTS